MYQAIKRCKGGKHSYICRCNHLFWNKSIIFDNRITFCTSLFVCLQFHVEVEVNLPWELTSEHDMSNFISKTRKHWYNFYSFNDRRTYCRNTLKRGEIGLISYIVLYKDYETVQKQDVNANITHNINEMWIGPKYVDSVNTLLSMYINIFLIWACN